MRYGNNEQNVNIGFVYYDKMRNIRKKLTFLLLTCSNKCDINVP